MPENYPDISFDHDGVCNYCHQYQPLTPQGEKQLREIIDFQPRSTNHEYDCIVPISGGRDSAFVLHQIVKKYSMKPLAYHYDNGFCTAMAKENIRNITRKLNVTLVQSQSKDSMQVSMMKENLKLNAKKSLLHIIHDLCNGCRNGYKDGAIKLAADKENPFVIFGDSKIEESIYKKKVFAHCISGLGEKIAAIIRDPLNFSRRHYSNYRFYREFPNCKPEGKTVQALSFFDFETWDEDTIVTTICKDAGWSFAGNPTSWRIDCKVHLLVDYFTHMALGYNEKDEIYSRLIRKGRLSRGNALAKIDAFRRNESSHQRQIERFFKEYNIDMKFLKKILEKNQCAV